MLWKEAAELVGAARSLRVFGIAVLLFGIFPALEQGHLHGPGGSTAPSVLLLVRLIYVMLAAMIIVSQTAPDLVLHERLDRTLDFLLTTRLPDAAIFGGKVLAGAAIGYVGALAAIAVQVIASALIGGNGWSWLFLASPEGRVVAFGLTAALCTYLSVVGTFVALFVGDPRAAYLVTMLCLGVLAVPFILGWIPIHLTFGWLGHGAIIFGAFDIVAGLAGVTLFRRDMLVLYLQQ